MECLLLLFVCFYLPFTLTHGVLMFNIVFENTFENSKIRDSPGGQWLRTPLPMQWWGNWDPTCGTATKPGALQLESLWLRLLKPRCSGASARQQDKPSDWNWREATSHKNALAPRQRVNPAKIKNSVIKEVRRSLANRNFSVFNCQQGLCIS